VERGREHPWGPALLAAAGVLAAAFTAVAVGRSDILRDPHLSAAARTAFVVANVAGGAYTWWRRPASGFGPLFAATGLLFALTSLNGFAAPLAFTLGRVVYAAVMFALVYVFLSFPGVRPASGADRRLVAGLAVVEVVVWVVVLALAERLPTTGPFSECAAACPHNALRVVDGAAQAGRVAGVVANAVTVASFLGVTVLLLVRLRETGRAGRRTLAPLFAAMCALLVALAAYTIAREAFDARPAVLSAAVAAAILLIPVAIVAGQVRGRLFAARRLGSLVSDVAGTPVTGPDVERLVGEALGDPTLTLARWDAVGALYRDLDGAPTMAHGRMTVELLRNGVPYALVAYDPAIDQAPDVVRGVAAGALVLLDNARLAEERGQLVDALRSSRARMATATHDERVRIERDLHDGVQARLNGLLLKLGLARDLADDPELRAALDEAGDDAAAAVQDLRTLARGVYPPVLRERGLAPALRAFAATAPVPVRVDVVGEGAAPDAALAAVYFTVLEAIQNAIKHGGGAVGVGVTLTWADGRLAFAVADDGAGFDPARTPAGVGRVSMDDRIGAVGGELTLASSPGAGTVVRGWVPAG
jgi:signal transduction histidine kinase